MILYYLVHILHIYYYIFVSNYLLNEYTITLNFMFNKYTKTFLNILIYNKKTNKKYLIFKCN